MCLSDFLTGIGNILWEYGTLLTFLFVMVCTISALKAWKKEQLRKEWNAAGKDVVVLHTFGRGYTSPNISPFALKLETYLRMAGYKIQIEEKAPMSSKGKSPWITLNGVDMTDSQLIIDHLSANNKSFSSHLSDKERAIANAFQIMVDEHLCWGLARYRYLTDRDARVFQVTSVYPMWMKYMLPLLRHMLRKALHAQGMGRHSDAEVLGIMRKDLESISIYLGEKPFLMGDEPCEVDCAIFGQLGQFLWNAPDSPYYTMVTEDFPNLQQYCLRMKEKFWPDWEEILDKPPK
ncbi:failed axon connections homolog [Macrobrachium rosenbergii]|uniref:failed axon connections homolog n=1 Tax=Macrobrachium rosenbergii TaxID=79674 RepID=UPI0034D57AF8